MGDHPLTTETDTVAVNLANALAKSSESPIGELDENRRATSLSRSTWHSLQARSENLVLRAESNDRFELGCYVLRSCRFPQSPVRARIG